MTHNSEDDKKSSIPDDESIAYLVAQAQELSELALKSGKPQASALFTLAVSDLRKKVG